MKKNNKKCNLGIISDNFRTFAKGKQGKPLTGNYKDRSQRDFDQKEN